MTSALILEPNMADPDSTFALLASMSTDCDDQEAHRRTARLLLLLANHLGDYAVLEAAVLRARQASPPTATS